MTVYKNAVINNELTDIIVENGKFLSLVKTDLQGIDLKGNKVYPGLIDIHTHGCTGFDAMDCTLEEMSDYHAKHGVTTWYPTTMTASFEALKAVSDIEISKIKGANIPGFHFEGPYIAEKYKGAQNPEYIRNPDYSEFKKFKNVKLVTIAPELDGSDEFIKNCECVVCIGHTEANYDAAIKAIDCGAKCLTHTFNAMPPIHHREPAVIGAAVEKNIYAQVSCDGLHIHPAAIFMLYKMFGVEKMIIISDSMRATGLSDGEYDLGGLNVTVNGSEARLSDGTLAGSVTTLLDGVRNVISYGIPEEDAFRMATQTPAELLGINKGKIAAGYDADFIVLDNKLSLLHTVIGGEIYK